MSDLRIGQPVSGYEIESVLGRGGSGSVYAARCDGRLVAIKVMHEHDRTGVSRKRFEREAALVKKLRHPNVVEIYDYGHTDDGLPYIVFELLEGRSLKEALAEGALGEVRAAQVALAVLDALVAAHELGIIHRDIKPGNIFLREGPGESVQVLDFGLAKALVGDHVETATLTKTGYRLGTPRYMSPEMARGLPVDESSDLYSLGLVVAEMVVGRPVIEGDVHVSIMLEHASDKPLELPEELRGSPLEPVIVGALQKDPTQRFRSAVAMREALRAALETIAPEAPTRPMAAMRDAIEAPTEPLQARILDSIEALTSPLARRDDSIEAPTEPLSRHNDSIEAPTEPLARRDDSIEAPTEPLRAKAGEPLGRPKLQGDGPTLLLTTPADPSVEEGTTKKMAKRGVDDPPTPVREGADGATQIWVRPDPPTRPLPPPTPPRLPPTRIEPWQAVALGVVLALTLFALGLAVAR